MPSSLTLAEVRSPNDDADEILLRTLAVRFKAVEHLRAIKREANVPTEDVVRENKLRDKWKKLSEKFKLRPEFALLILDIILVESKRLQDA